MGPPTIALPASVLGQLPQILCFSGNEQGEGETFSDWHEQFESIATLGRWEKHCKLVNLTTQLGGTAYSFYRSCSPEQWSIYDLLVTALQRRFTLVQLATVLTPLFPHYFTNISKPVKNQWTIIPRESENFSVKPTHGTLQYKSKKREQ